MKRYAVKETFLTLQGEGINVGRPAVFCRFSGCNLACEFCDTDFAGVDGDGGGTFTAVELAAHIRTMWIASDAPFIVFTGGEPLLQLDEPLIDELRDCTIAVETNGTRLVPVGVDWICVSPKANSSLVQTRGDELKLVYPTLPPSSFEGLNFTHFLLQPMDGPRLSENTTAAIDYCLKHPKWRLSTQTHKILGLR